MEKRQRKQNNSFKTTTQRSTHRGFLTVAVSSLDPSLSTISSSAGRLHTRKIKTERKKEEKTKGKTNV